MSLCQNCFRRVDLPETLPADVDKITIICPHCRKETFVEISHYDYADKYFFIFAEKAGVTVPKLAYGGIVSAHGDKFYGYRQMWEDAGISFNHGVLLALLSYLPPFSNTARTYVGGEWNHTGHWVIHNYPKLKHLLP